MAETRLTNVIVPSIFTGYTMEPSIYKSRFFKSGALARNESMGALLGGGGLLMNMPYWKDVAGTAGDVPSETVAATVNNIAADKQVFRRQFREKAWGSNSLARIEAGSDPMAALIAMVTDYWAQAYDLLSIYTMRGIIADNIANDSGDLVKDISSESGSAAYFSDAGVIAAQAKLGENGTVGRGDENGGDFVAILVHPLVYAYMRTNDLIDYVPISGQQRPLEFYMGMQVIVDRNAYVNSGTYDSYILKAGALQMGETATGYEPTETDRDATKGFGIDVLYTRRCFGIHPVGFAWADTSVAGVTPTDAEIYAATNWNRVFSAENARFVVLRHKIA